MVKKKYVCIPRSFLVINVCNQGKNLCSPVYRYSHHKTAYKYTGFIISEYAKNLFQHIFES